VNCNWAFDVTGVSKLVWRTLETIARSHAFARQGIDGQITTRMPINTVGKHFATDAARGLALPAKVAALRLFPREIVVLICKISVAFQSFCKRIPVNRANTPISSEWRYHSRSRNWLVNQARWRDCSRGQYTHFSSSLSLGITSGWPMCKIKCLRPAGGFQRSTPQGCSGSRLSDRRSRAAEPYEHPDSPKPSRISGWLRIRKIFSNVPLKIE
jgi:hypothetical protein